MDNKIELPQCHDGRYMLNQDAVNVIRRSTSMLISYNFKVKAQCFMKFGFTIKPMRESIDIQCIMPINVENFKHQFLAKINLHYRHPIQALVKDGSILSFEAYRDGLQNKSLMSNGLTNDVIYWVLNPSEDKAIKGYLVSQVKEIDSLTRLINEI